MCVWGGLVGEPLLTSRLSSLGAPAERPSSHSSTRLDHALEVTEKGQQCPQGSALSEATEISGFKKKMRLIPQ